MIDPRVVTQANSQNNGSRALKWGIVHFCSSTTFGENMIFQIFAFLWKKWRNHHTKSQKIGKFKNWQFFYKNAKIRKLQIF